MNNLKDEFYMNIALEEAKEAYDIGEVPIGCVVVYKDEVIGRGYNLRSKNKNTMAHAEMIAINQACEYLKDWRLEDCTIYSTVEPCIMCSGAIIQSRIKRLVFGTYNNKFGTAGSLINIFEIEGFNHKVEVTEKVLEYECSSIMKSFFRNLRKKVDK